MTELKIKQADINNNGNQRLTGENGGGVILKICIMFACGCTYGGGGGCTCFVVVFLPKIRNRRQDCNNDAVVFLKTILQKQHCQIY